MAHPFRISSLLPLIALLLAACAPPDTRDDPFPEPETLPALQSTVSEDTVRLGEIIEVNTRLTAEKPLSLPSWSDLLHPDIRLLDQHTPSGVTGEDGRWRQNQRLRIALYKVTEVPLFAEPSVQPLDDPETSIELPHVLLTTQSTIEDEEAQPLPGDYALMDFRGPDALRRMRRNILISILAFLALSALLATLWWRAKRKPTPPPPLPQWDLIALRKMQELRDEPCWRDGDADTSAVALSLILREYIERRFHIHAPELTTEEFLREAGERQPWSDEDHRELENVFHAFDRIKFAAERPGHDILEDLMRAAERFVRVTGQGGTP